MFNIFTLMCVACLGLVNGQAATTVLTTTATPKFPNVLAGLAADGHFTVFSDLLSKSGVLPQINASIHFTVFAPTDNAFAKLTADALDRIKNDPAKLADLVSTHVVLNQQLRLHGQQEDITLNTANHHQIRINTYNILHTVTANGINVTIKNIPIVHGIVHGIDNVMAVPTGNTIQLALNRSDLSTFTSLVVSHNLLNFFTADKDITLFIPNNNAFGKLSQNVMSYLEQHPADLAETLKYHVIRTMTVYSLGMIHGITYPSADNNHDNLMMLQAADGSLNVNHAKIVEKDIIATDGVIHIIDNVLVPVRVMVHFADQGIVPVG